MFSRSTQATAMALAALLAGTTNAFAPPTSTGSVLSTRDTSTALRAETDGPNRARTERLLEESMGDDWRLFRAKLVAKERAQRASRRAAENQRFSQGIRQPFASPMMPDNESPMMPEHNGNGHANLSGRASIATFNDQRAFQGGRAPFQNGRVPFQDRGAFQGGRGAFYDEKLARQEHFGSMFESTVAPILSSENQIFSQDPFLSPGELPIHLQSTSVQVDKHRWAHPIEHIEAGCVLIANEMIAGAFHQTIILVVDHSESEGTSGIIINRPIGGSVEAVATKHKSNLDALIKKEFHESPVAYGGPEAHDSYSILHGYGHVKDSKKLAPGVFIGGFDELLKETQLGRFDNSEALFVKGHAVWAAGQLEQEVRKGEWYPAAVSSDLILRYAGAPLGENDDPNDLWSDILTCIGGDYAKIAYEFGGVGDKRLSP